MRIDKGHEHAEWLAGPFGAALKKFNDAFAAHAGDLAGCSVAIPMDISPIVVGIATAERVKPIEVTERGSLQLPNGITRIRRVPAGPSEILLHYFNVGGAPFFATVAPRGIRGIAEVPLAFPEHVVTGVRLE